MAGATETLLIDESGLVTEGAISNVFLRKPEGYLVTPPLSLGLLPGVLRTKLVEEGEAREEVLKLSDLRDGFLIGNAVRGLVPARLLAQ